MIFCCVYQKKRCSNEAPLTGDSTPSAPLCYPNPVTEAMTPNTPTGARSDIIVTSITQLPNLPYSEHK